MCVHVCVCSCTVRGKRPGALARLRAWDRLGLSLSYLVVILQHLSDDSYLRMVVLYGDYSEKERTKAEARSALLLRSDGNTNLIAPKQSECGTSSQAHPKGLQAQGQVQLRPSLYSVKKKSTE